MAGNNVIKTLNQFLKGQYMGIHAYVHHIQIQNLRGTPVDDEGITGSIQSPAEASAGLISLTWI